MDSEYIGNSFDTGSAVCLFCRSPITFLCNKLSTVWTSVFVGRQTYYTLTTEKKNESSFTHTKSFKLLSSVKIETIFRLSFTVTLTWMESLDKNK